MDPDAIFIMLLYFILFILTVGSMIGLSIKTWNTGLSKPVKVSLIMLFPIYLMIAISKFSEVGGGALWVIGIIILPAFLVSLNWSIDLIRRKKFEKIKAPLYLKIILLAILIAILLLSILFLTAKLFDELDLMGTSG